MWHDLRADRRLIDMQRHIRNYNHKCPYPAYLTPSTTVFPTETRLAHQIDWSCRERPPLGLDLPFRSSVRPCSMFRFMSSHSSMKSRIVHRWILTVSYQGTARIQGQRLVFGNGEDVLAWPECRHLVASGFSLRRRLGRPLGHHACDCHNFENPVLIVGYYAGPLALSM